MPSNEPHPQDPIFKGNKVPNPEMGYPGGIFDPLGFSKGNLKELQTKEIKNGRIAMIAFMSFVVQVRSMGSGWLAGDGGEMAVVVRSRMPVVLQRFGSYEAQLPCSLAGCQQYCISRCTCHNCRGFA